MQRRLSSRATVWRAAAACGAIQLQIVAIAAAQTVEPISVEVTGAFQSPRIDESSGVAASRRYPGLLWTHNDSGDKPVLYATNLSGDDLGSVRVRGAHAKDWEDIALGPCPAGLEAGSCIYIADTGDNSGKRRTVAVYVVPEPSLDSSGHVAADRTARSHRLRVTYRNGPHDVEALAVAPSGDLFLFTKGRFGPALVFFISRKEVPTKKATAKQIMALPIVTGRQLGRLVTGAAISPDGRELAVRTYTELYFYLREGNSGLIPRGPPCWLGTVQLQGEGVDFLDSETVVLTSESVFGSRGTIAKAVCPARTYPK
ncbi:MAG: hypothetical protein ACE5HT_02105 [Gemmatimonadales bacterium]